MARGTSGALDYVRPNDSSTVGTAATMWKARGSILRTTPADRSRWDLDRAAEGDAPALERHVASPAATAGRFGFDTMIGQSPIFVAAVGNARKVAPTSTTVLLTGESGTGKEVLARAIHEASACADGPFVALNCAALPETLVESELFGHERGAFTGADRLKRGRFELAAGGTLFLDEIGELSPAVQAKLLRVLQERQYERIGGTATLKADIRLIAATNRDLERAVADGDFREDLYYRVAVFRIQLPALRERGEDVVLLADHFVRELGASMEGQEPRMTDDARERLLAHSWPGNIRELRNAIERALILSEGPQISAAHLGIAPPPPRTAAIGAVAVPPVEKASTMFTIAAQEERVIVEALQRTRGHQARAAALLGITRFQLYGRLKRYHIEIDRCLGAEQV